MVVIMMSFIDIYVVQIFVCSIVQYKCLKSCVGQRSECRCLQSMGLDHNTGERESLVFVKDYLCVYKIDVF
jgi:hypothetical protein